MQPYYAFNTKGNYNGHGKEHETFLIDHQRLECLQNKQNYNQVSF